MIWDIIRSVDQTCSVSTLTFNKLVENPLNCIVPKSPRPHVPSMFWNHIRPSLLIARFPLIQRQTAAYMNNLGYWVRQKCSELIIWSMWTVLIQIEEKRAHSDQSSLAHLVVFEWNSMCSSTTVHARSDQDSHDATVASEMIDTWNILLRQPKTKVEHYLEVLTRIFQIRKPYYQSKWLKSDGFVDLKPLLRPSFG